MRIAVLGDIHGNIEALKVAYETAVLEGVDKIFHTGDLGGYAPFVNEVVDFLIEHEILGVQGNYDEAIANNKPHCGCKYEDEYQAEMSQISFEWTKRKINMRSKNYMKNLPFSIEIEADELKVKIFHATPIKNNLYWYEHRPDKFYLLMAEKAQADVIIYGHTHVPYFRELNGRYFINAGSVGKPKDGDPRTCVAVVNIEGRNIHVNFIRKEYDIHRVVSEIIKAGLPTYFAEKLYLAR